MAGHLNRATIIGNLGKDPEVRRTQGGSSIVNFSIATTEQWRDKATGEEKKRTQWHSVVIFNEAIGKVAEKYLKKGSKALVEGQIETREWTDRDGNKRYMTEIVLRPFNGNLILLGDHGGGGNRPPANMGDDGGRGSTSTGSKTGDMGSVIDDEIPF